jgi:hypothetical protein
MRAYLFASDLNPDVNAFSGNVTGRNLPAEYAPWRILNGGTSLLVGLPSRHILEALERDAFCLLKDEPHRSR